MINKTLDLVIKKEAEKSAETMERLNLRENTGISDRIVFVEIDSATFKKWGSPLLTPRDALADLVRMAWTGGAKVVVLDILLEHRDCCNPEGDMKFRKLLQEITTARSPLKVIFPATIVRDELEPVKKNICHDLIAVNPSFYTASADFSAPTSDRVIRYWVPFETFKDGRNTAVLWNMSFLAVVLFEDKEADMQKLSSDISNRVFHKTYRFKLNTTASVAVSPDTEDIYYNRIRFLLVPKMALSYHPQGNLFEAAYTVDEAKHANFRDKIVIIGGSGRDAGDVHPTPIGDLAGMYIVGNSINTILSGKQPSRPPHLLNLLIEMFAIVVAAFLFLYLHAFLAWVLGSAMLLAMGYVSYRYFLSTGIFLNFVFAVAGMGLHRTFSNIEETIHNRGTSEVMDTKGDQDED